ncbi:MAG: PAS and helix-turn-helix domain-containing protein [Myxococcota bacterium]|nr:PAS and helix-turn-helix domain-containing protein [Myxococcota bacterium]
MALPIENPFHEKIKDIRSVVDEMSFGLFARDPGGRIVFANETLLRWTGYRHGDLLGQPAEILAPEELRDLVREERHAVEEGDRRARLCAIMRQDGTTIPAIFLPHWIHDEDGKPLGGISVIVELGAVQTAKPMGGESDDLRSALHRIGMELQRLSLSVDLGSPSLAPDHPALAELTEREFEVLARLMSGARVPAIASQLNISPHTVRNHLKSIYRKVGAKDQSDLIERIRNLPRDGGSVEE